MFVVFYNDEILREIPFDDVSSEMVLERTGYYGFYVRDEEGSLQNVGKFLAKQVYVKEFISRNAYDTMKKKGG